MAPRRALSLLVLVAASACSRGPQDAAARERSSAALPSSVHVPEPEPARLPAATTVAPHAEAKPTAKLAFVGDISISMHVAAYLEGTLTPRTPLEPDFPFAAVQDRLRSYDLAIGNFECVIGGSGKRRIPKPLLAPASAPRLLRSAGFDAVSVANNHAIDLFEPGWLRTLEALENVGLPYAGAHYFGSNDPVVFLEARGLRIAVVGHYERDPRLALEDVARARKAAEVVLVFIHWGTDYALDPIRWQRHWGRRLIDAGADAVIGAHPHVVQPEEIYDGKLIAHSLGNFVFSGMIEPGSRTGALLELDVSAQGVVDHRYRRVTLDDRGAPRFEGEPTREPPLDPARGTELVDLGAPMTFGL